MGGKKKMIAIIDYGMGNLKSVAAAVRRAGHEPVITNRHEDLVKAEKLILPGVGAFGDAMKNLRSLDLITLLDRLILKEAKPILGICLGSQLMAKESFEFGHHEGLGWIDASVVRLKADEKKLRIPHVGWNDLIRVRDDILFKDIPDNTLFYYVHSFETQCNEKDIVIGECDYGSRFTAAFHRGNIYATQFHPEKSQFYGLQLLKNYLENA